MISKYDELLRICEEKLKNFAEECENPNKYKQDDIEEVVDDVVSKLSYDEIISLYSELNFWDVNIDNDLIESLGHKTGLIDIAREMIRICVLDDILNYYN